MSAGVEEGASAPRRYVRTKDGKVVHDIDCPIVKRIAFPSEWKWAEGMTVPQIKMQALRVGVKHEFHKGCLG